MSVSSAPSSKLKELRGRYFPPSTLLYYKDPLHLVRAKGCEVWDVEGRSFLDAIGGIVCISVGHNHPRIKGALKEMLEGDAIQHTSTIYLSQPAHELAQALVERAPSSVSKVCLSNSGSEANEIALMAVRQATGETQVLSLRHAYHGGTSGTLAQCGNHHWRYAHQPVGQVAFAKAPYCYRCPVGLKPDTCQAECAQDVEEVLLTTGHGRAAAMMVEPILGVGGFITPPDLYFERLGEILERHGVKLIVDEVQTGVGRCGESFFHSSSLPFKPDAITLAKGLGNGAAIGATLLSDELAQSMAGKLQFNTFGGDPYPCHQASLTVGLVDEEGLIENARDRGEQLRAGLRELQGRHPFLGDVRGRGLLVGVEVVKDGKVPDPETCARIHEACREQGLLVGKGGLYGQVLRLAPPLSITSQEVKELLKRFEKAVQV